MATSAQVSEGQGQVPSAHPWEPRLIHEMTAEFFGTMMILLFGIGVVAQHHQQASVRHRSWYAPPAALRRPCSLCRRAAVTGRDSTRYLVSSAPRERELSSDGWGSESRHQATRRCAASLA